VLWASALLVWGWLHSQAGPSADTAAWNPWYSSQNGELPVLWDAPAFSYPDQNGRTVTGEDLRGHIWIADFFFTSCTSICPMMTAKMAHLLKTISDGEVRFVSFSVDPDHDTPAVLQQYARMWKADDSRWKFLSTNRKDLAATAEGMRTFVQPPSEDSPIQHSGLFILTDKEGRVRGVYDSSDDTALRRLVRDTARLAGRRVAVPAEEANTTPVESVAPSTNPQNVGAALYAARGCLGCHAQGRVAPALEGCFGRKVLLADGRTVISDEAYLRESILDPGEKVVAGYPAMMPGYRGQLTDVELNEVVAYLKALKPVQGDAGVETARAQIVDPVCKMPLDPSSESFEADFSGKTYHFCSKLCRDRFLKSPERFAK
jgi:protein SCO1/2